MNNKALNLWIATRLLAVTASLTLVWAFKTDDMLLGIFSLGLACAAVFAGYKTRATKRSFAVDDWGVSPVIAVILMVAITVVLAVTVFVLLQNIGKQPPPGAILGITKSGNDALVTQAPTGYTWAEFTVTGCTPPPNNTTVDAGDRLTSCTGHVTVTHTANGGSSLVWEADYD